MSDDFEQGHGGPVRTEAAAFPLLDRPRAQAKADREVPLAVPGMRRMEMICSRTRPWIILAMRRRMDVMMARLG
jgi:hypothetical protein